MADLPANASKLRILPSHPSTLRISYVRSFARWLTGQLALTGAWFPLPICQGQRCPLWIAGLWEAVLKVLDKPKA